MLIIRCREPSLHLSDYMPVQEKKQKPPYQKTTPEDAPPGIIKTHKK